MTVWNFAGKCSDAKVVFASWAVPAVWGRSLRSESLETFVVTLVWDLICAGAGFLSVSVGWLGSTFCMQREKSKRQEAHVFIKQPYTSGVLQFRK